MCLSGLIYPYTKAQPEYYYGLYFLDIGTSLHYYSYSNSDAIVIMWLMSPFTIDSYGYYHAAKAFFITYIILSRHLPHRQKCLCCGAKPER